MIPLSSPDITEREKSIVMQVLDSKILCLGPKLKEFEEKIAAYAGTKHAIACNSGTSGLHMIVAALGIKDGDEVITTPFSFISSSNCMLFERAKPVFVDIDEVQNSGHGYIMRFFCHHELMLSNRLFTGFGEIINGDKFFSKRGYVQSSEVTYNMDVSQIEAKITSKTKAILPVHIFGQPVNMDEVRKLAEKYGLYIIEDACEAIGAKWNGEMAGTMSDAGVFAFYPNKQMTTGEGGVVVTNNDQLAEICFSLRNQGRGIDKQWLHHVRLGYNYRMSDISAALGIAQLERIDEMLERRQKVSEMYLEKFRNVEGVILPRINEQVTMSWFVFVIRFEEGIDRNIVMGILLERGIGCRPYFTAIHLQPFYVEQFGYKLGEFPVTEKVAQGTLALPFFNGITEEQIDTVVNEVKRAVGYALLGPMERLGRLIGEVG